MRSLKCSGGTSTSGHLLPLSTLVFGATQAVNPGLVDFPVQRLEGDPQASINPFVVVFHKGLRMRIGHHFKQPRKAEPGGFGRSPVPSQSGFSEVEKLTSGCGEIGF